MKDVVKFLFIIDVSGSMYGQKIAAVNAALTECLAELRQIGCLNDYDIQVSIATFAEKMQLHILNQNPDSVIAPCFKVEPQSDGFYPLTSFECLYKGLQSLFDNNEFDDGKQGENTLIYLFSDAKPVDSKTYENVFETMQNYPSYKNAAKYIAFVDEKEDKYNKHTIKFVDYKAEKIIQMIDIPGEISKLQMTFFSNFSSPDENERYDRIFI